MEVPAGGGSAEASSDALYLALSLRNAGNGIAVLHGWRFYPQRVVSADEHPPLEEFHRLSRDLYVPVSDIGFWQGAFRDPTDPNYPSARRAIESRQPITVDLLYGDHKVGQRVISRFTLTPRDSGQWMAATTRHWNVDRPDPR